MHLKSSSNIQISPSMNSKIYLTKLSKVYETYFMKKIWNFGFLKNYIQISPKNDSHTRLVKTRKFFIKVLQEK